MPSGAGPAAVGQKRAKISGVGCWNTVFAGAAAAPPVPNDADGAVALAEAAGRALSLGPARTRALCLARARHEAQGHAQRADAQADVRHHETLHHRYVHPRFASTDLTRRRKSSGRAGFSKTAAISGGGTGAMPL